MSFILDALRKAEDKNRDRHNMTVPQGPRVLDEALPEAPPAERNSAVVLILMGAVIASAVWWFMRDTTPNAPARVAATSPVQRVAVEPVNQTQAASSRPLPAERPNIRRDTGARALDQEARRGDAPSTSASTASQADPSTVRPGVASNGLSATLSGGSRTIKPGTVTILEPDGSMPTSAPTPTSNTTPTSTAGPAAAANSRVREETLPQYRESLTSGEVPIPQLHLDIHVYSAEPKKRFVFINLDKYGEGDSIDKDTTVESIEPQGAVINHKGYRFVLQPD
ncbi:MAG: general secretion pathway protein GspB [Gammaproteobacteria bacterium]